MFKTPYKTKAIAGHAIRRRLPLFASAHWARAARAQCALLFWRQLRRSGKGTAGQSLVHPELLCSVSLGPSRTEQESIFRLKHDAARRQHASRQRLYGEIVRKGEFFRIGRACKNGRRAHEVYRRAKLALIVEFASRFPR